MILLLLFNIGVTLLDTSLLGVDCFFPELLGGHLALAAEADVEDAELNGIAHPLEKCGESLRVLSDLIVID